MEESGPTYRAAEMLQTTATIAAIVLALATLAEEQGPDVQGVYLIPFTLFFAGLFAVAGSLFAIEDVREEVSGRESDWVGLRLLLVGHGALFFSIWAIRVAGAAFLWLLFDMAP